MQIHFGPDPELKARFADGTVIADTRLVDERFDDLEARGLTFSGVTLTRCTFRGCRFDDLTFRNVRLRDVRFEQCVFAGSTWEAVDGAKVRVEDCRFVRRRPKDEPEGAEADPEAGRCVFRDVSLTDASLKDTRLDGTRWTRVAFHDGKLGASFVGARFVDATFTAEEQVDFSGADFTDTNIDRRVFAGARLRAARLPKDLAGVRFGKAYLYEAKLEEADLSGADLSGASLGRAALKGANLRRAQLPRADLSEADCREADFTGANLFRAVCTRTRFDHATLDRASLRRSRCNQAAFVGAAARGCDFLRAELGGADLRDATLDGSRLRGAFTAEANVAGMRARWVWMSWSLRLALVRANAPFALPLARDLGWVVLSAGLLASLCAVSTVDVAPGRFLTGLRAFVLGGLAFLFALALLRSYLGLFAGFRAVGTQPWAVSPLPPLLPIRPAPPSDDDDDDEIAAEMRALEDRAASVVHGEGSARQSARLSRRLQRRRRRRQERLWHLYPFFSVFLCISWVIFVIWSGAESLPGSAGVRAMRDGALAAIGGSVGGAIKQVVASPNPLAALLFVVLAPVILGALWSGGRVLYTSVRRGAESRRRLGRAKKLGVRGTLAHDLAASYASEPNASAHLAEDFPRSLALQGSPGATSMALTDIGWAAANPRLDRRRQGRPEAVLHAKPGDRVWFDDTRSPAVLFTAPPDVDVRSRMAFWTVNLLLHGLPFVAAAFVALCSL